MTSDVAGRSAEHRALAIEAVDLRYRYGRHIALDGLTMTVPQGALYGLLGPNGSGKTTLLHLLMGLRRPSHGVARIGGRDARAFTVEDRQHIGYVAEGQALPRGMRIADFEAYLRPLYPSWDHALVHELHERLALDPARRIGALSRGEYMKAALLFALAPRPSVLLMDEPFTGMDASIKDELVRGLLESSAEQGCTILLCSHDLAELEPLADWVGFLAHGRMHFSEPMERLQSRFQRVEVVIADGAQHDGSLDPAWLDVERAGRRLQFLVPNADDALVSRELQARFPDAASLSVRPATLREIFVAMTRATRTSTSHTVASAAAAHVERAA
jgi:ABC-2 type transport system ATP-binding protein